MPRKVTAPAQPVEFTEPPAAAAPAADERTDRAECPVCGRRAYVRADGTFLSHRSPTPGVRCNGQVPE